MWYLSSGDQEHQWWLLTSILKILLILNRPIKYNPNIVTKGRGKSKLTASKCDQVTF